MAIEILYNIGDKVAYNYSEYDDDTGDYVQNTYQGYVFAIEVSQEGTFRGKKGYRILYKIHRDFEGIHWGWRYASERV